MTRCTLLYRGGGSLAAPIPENPRQFDSQLRPEYFEILYKWSPCGPEFSDVRAP